MAGRAGGPAGPRAMPARPLSFFANCLENSIEGGGNEERKESGFPLLPDRVCQVLKKKKQKWKERKENVVQKDKPSCTHCKKEGHDEAHC